MQRKTDRMTDRMADRMTDRQTQTERFAGRIDWRTNRQTDRHACKIADGHTDTVHSANKPPICMVLVQLVTTCMHSQKECIRKHAVAE